MTSHLVIRNDLMTTLTNDSAAEGQEIEGSGKFRICKANGMHGLHALPLHTKNSTHYLHDHVHKINSQS